MLATSYSQASAYVIVFVHFDGDRKAVCAHLATSDDSLSRQVTAAADTVRVQPSLFDRIERISQLPVPARQAACRSCSARRRRRAMGMGILNWRARSPCYSYLLGQAEMHTAYASLQDPSASVWKLADESPETH
jgi:hypothetical protein